MTQRLNVAVKDILEYDFSKDIFNQWSEFVRGPRNAIAHGTKMYDHYKVKLALRALIVCHKFIFKLLPFVPVNQYQDFVMEELKQDIVFGGYLSNLE